MTPEQADRLARFNRRFRIVPTSLLGRARDLSHLRPGPLVGDCQTYCRTVRSILGLKPWQGVRWRCWSKEGRPRWVPRHAVLWVKGKGWIDSTHREFRPSPAPHRRLWPIGTPTAAGITWAVGLWNGWWGVGWLVALLP